MKLARKPVDTLTRMLEGPNRVVNSVVRRRHFVSEASRKGDNETPPEPLPELTSTVNFIAAMENVPKRIRTISWEDTAGAFIEWRH